VRGGFLLAGDCVSLVLFKNGDSVIRVDFWLPFLFCVVYKWCVLWLQLSTNKIWYHSLIFRIPLTPLISWQDFAHYKSGVYKHITGSALGGHAVKLIGWGTSDEGEDYWVCWQYINLFLILDNKTCKYMLLLRILCILIV